MKRNTYLLGIFFLAITVVAGLVHGTLLLLQGFSFIYNQSYATWYLTSNIVYLLSNLFVLRYFYIKQWKFVFTVGSISLVIFIAQFILQYIILVRVARELAGIQSIIAMSAILISLVFAAALIAQARPKKIFLPLSSLVIVLGLVLLGALIALMQGSTGEFVVNVIIWANLLSSLLPLFFIAAFQYEARQLQPEAPSSSAEQALYSGGSVIALISILLLFIVGYQLSQESYWHRYWQKHGPEGAKKIAQRFEARFHVGSKGDTLHYLFMRPLDYDSLEQYPLVTCLHGGPTRIASNVEITQPAPMLSEEANRKKYPSFLFVPQARPGVLWGGVPGVPQMDSIVFEAMDAIEKQFSIDPDRRYITGASGGGYGTWHFICSYPDRFAAAMPVCGMGNPALASKIAHVPVWAFHGDVDRNVPVTGSRNMIEALRLAGGNPKYNEYAGVGHNVWPEIEKTEGVLDWMFAQKRGRLSE